jgi:hypothetical protein
MCKIYSTEDILLAFENLITGPLFIDIYGTIINMFITFCIMIFACKSVIIIYTSVFHFIQYTLTILTSDYQYIEAALMCSFIIMVIVSIIAMNEIVDKLCNSIMQLKDNCKQKDTRIAALEEEIAMLTNKSVTTNDNLINDNLISDNLISDNLISDNLISDNLISDNVISDNLINDNVISDNLINDNLINDNLINDNLINDNVISDNVINDNVINDNYTIEGAFLI